jgi:hypothetical protein
MIGRIGSDRPLRRGTVCAVALMGCGSPTEPEGMKIKVTYIYCNQDGTVCRDTTEWR